MKSFINNTCLFLCLLLYTSITVQTKSLAQEHNGLYGGRDNSLEIACNESVRLENTEHSAEWCRCIGIYYANLLNESDWNTYIKDYFALIRTQNSGAYTEANSYERYVEIGGYTCSGCVTSNYTSDSCTKIIKTGPNKQNYTSLMNNLRDGHFEKIRKDAVYNGFFHDFLYVYGQYCANHIPDYTTIELDSEKGEYLRIETPLAESYEWRSKQETTHDTLEFLNSVINVYKKEGGATDIVTDGIKHSAKPIMLVRQALEGQCDTPDTQKTYENLKRFELGDSPIANENTDSRLLREEQEKIARDKRIREQTQESYKRYQNYLVQKEIMDKQRPKEEMGSQCSEQFEIYKNRASETPRYTGGMRDMVGTWSAEIFGVRMEMLTWNTGRNKDFVNMFGYIPESDCFLITQVGPGLISSAKNKHALQLQPVGIELKSGNCSKYKMDHKHPYETNKFKIRGFLNSDGRNKKITVYPVSVKFGILTPKSCEAMAPTTFTPDRISHNFISILEWHNQKNPRNKIPEDIMAIARRNITPPQYLQKR